MGITGSVLKNETNGEHLTKSLTHFLTSHKFTSAFGPFVFICYVYILLFISVGFLRIIGKLVNIFIVVCEDI